MHENQPNHSNISAASIVDAIASNPEFAEDRDNYGLMRAFSRQAFRLAGVQMPDNPQTHEQDLEDNLQPELQDITAENAIYVVTAELNSYVHGIEGIRHHHEQRGLGRDTYQALKGRATRFNHALKTLIEQDNPPSFKTISKTITDMYDVLNAGRWDGDEKGYNKEKGFFRGQLEGVLRGMEQEVVARQLIDLIGTKHTTVDFTGKRIPRVTVDSNVSVEDDLKGVDMYVTLDDVTFPIDIKASERTAENSRRKSAYPRHIITSGIDSRKIGGNFRASQSDMERESDKMLAKLYKARDEYLRKNPAAANLTLAA